MFLPLFLLLAAAVFITQLVFCIYAKRLWIKLLPVGAAMILSGICWGLYFSGIVSSVYGGDFAAYIYGIVLLMAAVIAGAAWGIYGIVKLVQNLGK